MESARELVGEECGEDGLEGGYEEPAAGPGEPPVVPFLKREESASQ